MSHAAKPFTVFPHFIAEYFFKNDRKYIFTTNATCRLKRNCCKILEILTAHCNKSLQNVAQTLPNSRNVVSFHWWRSSSKIYDFTIITAASFPSLLDFMLYYFYLFFLQLLRYNWLYYFNMIFSVVFSVNSLFMLVFLCHSWYYIYLYIQYLIHSYWVNFCDISLLTKHKVYFTAWSWSCLHVVMLLSPVRLF